MNSAYILYCPQPQDHHHTIQEEQQARWAQRHKLGAHRTRKYSGNVTEPVNTLVCKTADVKGVHTKLGKGVDGWVQWQSLL